MNDIGCEVIDMLVTGRGAFVVVPEFQCPDMTAAIAFFTRINPNVRLIVVSDTSGVGVVYHRCQLDGEWEAHEARVPSERVH